MNFSAISQEKLPVLLREMPKTELHVHIEGTLEPELIFSLAKRNGGVHLNYASVEDLRNAYEFQDLQSFLNIWQHGAKLPHSHMTFSTWRGPILYMPKRTMWCMLKYFSILKLIQGTIYQCTKCLHV